MKALRDFLDLIYACQDVDHDRGEGLQSVPARFGMATALRLSAVSHALTMVLLIGLGWVMGLTWPYWAGLVVVFGLLAWEHAVVHPDDLSRVNVAFFNVNSYISMTLFASVIGALWVQ